MESKLTSTNIWPPTIILAVASAMLIWYAELSSSLKDIIYWMPYGLAAVTAMLAIQFNRRQLIVVVLVNTFSYWLIVQYLQQPLDVPEAKMAFTLVCVFIPCNMVLNLLIKENGSKTLRAFLHYWMLIVQALVITILINYLSVDAQSLIENWFAPRPSTV
ncbi:hypothetical protein [Agarivorans gilvus]|uniref:hypothetical protein n=1 Tax=Agarivorans gilvus TaxID=680279 RepID=UPI0006EBF64F|nr:hypothetical protein [Agarivorans gilvus]